MGFFFQQDSSELQEVYSWVSQASLLGPLLFLLFVNDVSNFTIEGCVLAHWVGDNMNAIFQTTVSNAFSWMKMNFN